MNTAGRPPIPAKSAIPRWSLDGTEVLADARALVKAARRAREPVAVVQLDDTSAGAAGAAGAIAAVFGGTPSTRTGAKLVGALPALYPEHLGARDFAEVHGCRFPYVVGEMANGIATAEMVIAAHAHGLLGFFGAAGLAPPRVAAALDVIEKALGSSKSWGSNLIHSPHEPHIEDGIVDLYLARGVERVSASAYMALTPMVVRYAASGLRVVDGKVARRNRVFAKISRPETARHFLEPAPQSMLDELVRAGKLTDDEARIASRVPVATDITVEADSGGHTDNQALTAVFPTVQRLAADIERVREYEEPIRVGAAGGLGTPASIAAAFSMGAAYVLTGSVNQSAVESGLSARGKRLLAEAALGDVMMAPAADMFEMGVKVQVLKRGTMFASRAHRLYEAYRAHASWEAVSSSERAKIEREILGGGFDEIWASTQAFFRERDPAQLEKAAKDEKHKMALVFRAYLGKASKWAIAGDDDKALDFQIWCGPAMGAFNAWVKGSFLEKLEERTVGQIGLNLLEGAAVLTRAQQLRSFGAAVPDDAFRFAPRRLVFEGMELAQ